MTLYYNHHTDVFLGQQILLVRNKNKRTGKNYLCILLIHYEESLNITTTNMEASGKTHDSRGIRPMNMQDGRQVWWGGGALDLCSCMTDSMPTGGRGLQGERHVNGHSLIGWFVEPLAGDYESQDAVWPIAGLKAP